MLSGPLSDTVGARLFARYSSQEGYYDIVDVDSPVDTSDAAALLGPAAFLFGNNPALPSSASNAPESEDLFLRGTLTFEPTDAFDARVKLTYSDRKFDSFSQFWQRSFCPLGSPNGRGIPLSVLSPGVDIYDCRCYGYVVTGDRSPAQLSGFSFGNPDADGSRNPEIFLGSLEMNYYYLL